MAFVCEEVRSLLESKKINIIRNGFRIHTNQIGEVLTEATESPTKLVKYKASSGNQMAAAKLSSIYVHKLPYRLEHDFRSKETRSQATNTSDHELGKKDRRSISLSSRKCVKASLVSDSMRSKESHDSSKLQCTWSFEDSNRRAFRKTFRKPCRPKKAKKAAEEDMVREEAEKEQFEETEKCSSKVTSDDLSFSSASSTRLKHTDSFVLSAKRWRSPDAPHYQQPQCIKLSQKQPSAMAGKGAVRSCLKSYSPVSSLVNALKTADVPDNAILA